MYSGVRSNQFVNVADHWRYRFHNGRWWYWTPGNAWMYFDNGTWQAYAVPAPAPYTSAYGGDVLVPNYTPYYNSYPGYYYGGPYYSQPWGGYGYRGFGRGGFRR